MGKFLEELEIAQLDCSDLIRDLEAWKSEYEDYELVDPVAMIETFEDMLINN